MIFVTREHYNGIQPGSGWERKAEREWKRRMAIYVRHYEVISPLLPTTVRQLCKHGLHDAVVESAVMNGRALTLEMDATHALSGYRGRRLRLRFLGVRKRVPSGGLAGQWWLYTEAHLTSGSRFSLHVMFDKTDVEIEADELEIKKL
jgi:hypothetical protein